jgi:hypothetical protein
LGINVLYDALTITGFIFMMMLVIEYLNVLSKGAWQCRLRQSQWGQYLFSAVMGAIPGCLGAFTVVSLYMHGMVSVGALVTVMIATSGDEAFFMLALIPDRFLLITLVLVVVGVAAGWVTDRVWRRRDILSDARCDGFEIHADEDCVCFAKDAIVDQLKNCSLARASLCVLLAAIGLSVITGVLGPRQWNWIRVTLVTVSTAGLFVVVTVPEHFLEEHLWQHVAKRHLPRLFLWTFGTLAVLAYLETFVDVEAWAHQSRYLVLLIACLIGIIPESGPHIAFIALFAQGIVPFSTLLANSIVQDGHAGLPLLAHSRRDFVSVKFVNFVAGLAVGLTGLWVGW